MHKITRKIDNEQGYVLFFTMMILVLMAVAGATMLSNSSIDSYIVRNNSERTLKFYEAESAVMEAGQRLEHFTDSIRLNGYDEPWLNDNASSSPKLAALSQSWSVYDPDSGSFSSETAQEGLLPDTAFTAVRAGVAKSAELGMENESLLYEYVLVGRAFDRTDPSLVVASIEAGYLKRH